MPQPTPRMPSFPYRQSPALLSFGSLLPDCDTQLPFASRFRFPFRCLAARPPAQCLTFVTVRTPPPAHNIYVPNARRLSPKRRFVRKPLIVDGYGVAERSRGEVIRLATRVAGGDPLARKPASLAWFARWVGQR